MERIVWDPAKCVGCRMCEAICSLSHEGEFNPTKARIKVVRVGEDGMLYPIRVVCQHCEEPFCQAVCPVGAPYRDERGAMIIDEAKCIGCRSCETACPMRAITVHPEKHVALKCDWCAGMETPQCVKFCSGSFTALSLIPAEKVGSALVWEKMEKFVNIEKKGGMICQKQEGY